MNKASSKSSHCEVIAITNQKGGVGKTTTAVNLATALSACDKKILIIDMDAQGNASTGFGLQEQDRRASSYDLVTGQVSLAEAVHETYIKNLHIIPAHMNLSGMDIETADSPYRETMLKEALADAHRQYDYIFIDCPPGLNVLTMNALCAADEVLIPLQCEFYALEGITHLMRTIGHVRRRVNPNLQILGIVLTMYDARNRLSEQVTQDVRRHFPDKVFQTIIPRNVRISEAPSHGKPVILYDFECRGSQAYIQLAKEVLRQKV